MYVTGIVLAGGGSGRLGLAGRLLAYQGGALLGATLQAARDCAFDQLVVTLDGAADRLREQLDLAGMRVVGPDGAAPSLVGALEVVSPRCDGIVVLLGDQPGATAAAVWSLVAGVAGPSTPIGVCRYEDGRGHPFWFARELFGELRGLRGERSVWELIESGLHQVTEVDATGNIAPDPGEWADGQVLTPPGRSGVPGPERDIDPVLGASPASSTGLRHHGRQVR